MRVAFTPDEEVGKGAPFRRGGLQCRMGLYRGRRRRRRAGAREFQRRLGDDQNSATACTPAAPRADGCNALSLPPAFHQARRRTKRRRPPKATRAFITSAASRAKWERAEMHYILRDFEREDSRRASAKMVDIAREVGKGLPRDCLEVSIEDSYYNMREQAAEHRTYCAGAAGDARPRHRTGDEADHGGTDGAQPSFRGLPCPNLFTGGYNYHGKHEFVTLEAHGARVAVTARIAALAAERAR
ncbi:hypothetical protein M8494_13955 [Serratia ureilytica]